VVLHQLIIGEQHKSATGAAEPIGAGVPRHRRGLGEQAGRLLGEVVGQRTIVAQLDAALHFLVRYLRFLIMHLHLGLGVRVL